MTRDMVATAAVAAAVVVYLLWVADASPPGLSSARATGLAVLALGFVASASAVVPGFAALMHGNRAYLALTSLLGLAALAAGIRVLWVESTGALAVLTGALVLLWAIATTHHVQLAEGNACPECGGTVHAGSCEVCGYDLVRRTRAEITAHRPPL